MTYQFKIQKRVEFAETDMAGIVHFSNLFKYMEMAEHAFFRSLGFSMFNASSQENCGWPRVHADCDFKQPLRFEDIVEVHLQIKKISNKSITYQFTFRKIDHPNKTLIGTGRMTVVFVRFDPSNKSMKAAPIPKSLREKIEVDPVFR